MPSSLPPRLQHCAVSVEENAGVHGPRGAQPEPRQGPQPLPQMLGLLAAGSQLCPSLELPISSRAWPTQGHTTSQRAARGQGLAALL